MCVEGTSACDDCTIKALDNVFLPRRASAVLADTAGFNSAERSNCASQSAQDAGFRAISGTIVVAYLRGWPFPIVVDDPYSMRNEATGERSVMNRWREAG